jgi:hypothetical protein
MMLLTEFFKDLINIQLLKTSIIDNTPETNNQIYNEYIQQRLEFTRKYSRLCRGIDLLTDDQYSLLYDYFSGKYISGKNLKSDRKIAKMIYEVENAI